MPNLMPMPSASSFPYSIPLQFQSGISKLYARLFCFKLFIHFPWPYLVIPAWNGNSSNFFNAFSTCKCLVIYAL
jgi:hypothetical protein